MTREEFDNTKWKAGMKARINGKEKGIISVDFQKGYIGLTVDGNAKKIDWVKREHCEIV